MSDKMAATRQSCFLTNTTYSRCTKLLLKTFVTIFIFVQLQANVSGVIYESVEWISNNPRFMRGIKDQNCKDDEVLEIRVHYGSKLTFLCPTPVMVPDTVQQDLSKEALYENLWIVYDKWRFDTCTVPNTPKPLLLCDNPKSLKYFTFYFNMYSASKRLDFPHEKYYYFFSTSDGTVGSLNNTAHGHCNDTKEKVAMKFRLFVCAEKSTKARCNDTNFPFGKFRCVSNRTGASPNVTTGPPVPATPDVAARGGNWQSDITKYLAIGFGGAFGLSFLVNVILLMCRHKSSSTYNPDEEDGSQLKKLLPQGREENSNQLPKPKPRGPPPSVQKNGRGVPSCTNRQDKENGSQLPKPNPRGPPPSVPKSQRAAPKVLPAARA